MTVAIIDYGSGNLRSAAKALERAAGEAGLDCQVLVTADPDQVRRAGHVVLPGVGAFGDCRRGLDSLPGMIEALEQAVRRDGRPFLGICVGMQLMASVGREHGDHPGLGWIPGEVVALAPASPAPTSASTSLALKVPHMGWNHLHVKAPDHPVLDGLAAGAYVYFVHGFELRAANPSDVLATTDYGGPVTAVVGHDNLIGTQFHPEKSQAAGLGLLANFLRWRP
jgi:glutamine amidotransferase